MKSRAASWSLLFLILSLWRPLSACSQDVSSSPLPAVLNGTITDAISGYPIVGVKISVNDHQTWSVAGGIYSLEIEPVGTFPVEFTKAGFDLYASQPVDFQQGVHVTMDVLLWENLNPPEAVFAILDTSLQTVFMSWNLPQGDYELLYDDGIRDEFTVWAFQGNMSAVRYTPVDFPVSVTGGSVHIGDSSDYPAGSSPLVPFQVAVYDASGASGMPGTLIAGPFDVIPATFGWNEFTFPFAVDIAGGEFYLVMVQGGNAPNAAGIGVDMTNNKLRSVSRFVTGSAPWVPAGGNFMMRAVLHGPGGPLDSGELTENLLQYRVFRLRQGEEQNPGIWTDLGATANLSMSDASWFNLPCGPYRWGIKAEYANTRFSPATFSNVLGKCWTVGVTVEVELSCEEADKAGTFVSLKNLVYPDTLYTATLDTGGQHTFPLVWKGSYELSVSKFGYQSNVNIMSLTTDSTASVMLLQEKPPPVNLQVDAKTLVAQWDIPYYIDTLFYESWASGSFFTQEWTLDGGYNWIVSSAIGNPAPSAMFSWSPQVQNYEQTLTSKTITGLHSPLLTFCYDIFLDNFGTTTVNQMAVEIWDGSAWNVLKITPMPGEACPGQPAKSGYQLILTWNSGSGFVLTGTTVTISITGMWTT